ncbi:isoaspartyl peptidase/L-asparaginase [Aliifodinibius sp. S!AR15-10]|uniref:isoaspartyl peptidase/L-asparaginase family protein n=1 Tax=Aliifodinibius sp. S!AR15-10 TaxID=2950437 RepID=UPI00285DCE0C|nr:isoaspartyl peptidase/L-asparaginase [Aliifodinibius sp. S!AR15-10]MDR8393478.1 isoaspartyl peptidase/L-asparaginase [Aliifodinibius sp. S!AR15-10]
MISKLISLVLPLFIALTVMTYKGKPDIDRESKSKQKAWAIAIHGGAGTISKNQPDSVVQEYRAALNEALSIGKKILSNGGSSVDAVEKTINYLEDNPLFNAGKGSVFTHEGKHELDAAIMIGNTRQAGAVTGVRTVKNPISLARLVMEKSKHVMFATEGAEEFATKVGVERVDQEYFYTESRYRALQQALQEDDQSIKLDATDGKREEAGPDVWRHQFGTVGCVAVDKNGQIVAGTSTGGMTNKMYGRVGDVPIIGAGTYASDLVAISMTGWGEKIMRSVSGHTVSSYMRFREATLSEAGDYLLQEVLNPGEAGLIAVDRHGNIYMDMNTQGMFRGAADSQGRNEIAIWK